MNTIITRLDGTVYDLDALGITTVDFVVSSPVPKHTTETTQGRHGSIDMGTVYEPRPIVASFYFAADGYYDYAQKRDDVFRLFRTVEPFYIEESRNPGKRWRVKVDRPFTPNQEWKYGFFSVDLIAYSGFAESVGTSLAPRVMLDGLLTWALPGEPSELKPASFTTSTFTVYNDGDTAVNPRFMPLLITFKGASTNLKIRNNTTGDEWAFTGTTTVSDTVRLDGVRSTRNNLSILRDTNKRLITIAPGANNFVLTGTSGAFTMTFDFRYYYL